MNRQALFFAAGFLKLSSASFLQVQEILSSQNMTLDRGIPIDAVTNLFDYGCWCYNPDTGFGMGRGNGVDEFDKMCKVLAHNYECLIMDGCTNNGEEDPWAQTYEYPSITSIFTSDEAGILADCEANNAGDSCHQEICKAEMIFTARILYAIGATGFDSDLKHENGFDARAEGNCQKIEGAEVEDFTLECCGSYPTRRPYKQTESRQCCNGKTYNPDHLQCCQDSGLTAIGNIC